MPARWAVFVATYMLQTVSLRSYTGRTAASLQNNQLHSVTKRDIQQRAERVSEFMGHRLGGEAQKTGQRDDSNGVHGEDDGRGHAVDLGDGNADGHKDEQHVDLGGEHDCLAGVPEPLHDGLLFFFVDILLLVVS